MNTEKKRIIYFDLLNIVAALSVIFLHCNGNSFYYENTLGWKQAMLVETVCYWAVPVFLMLSGAKLMRYREKYTTAEFFKKRFMRTVIPFVIWTVIVSIVKNITPFSVGLKKYIDDFFNCRIENVYWFFIPLFAVYISIPVISLLKDNKKILWYMAGGSFILSSVLPHVFGYLGITYNNYLAMQTVGGMLIFPIIGYLFATTDFNKKQRLIIYALAVFGVALRFLGTLYLSGKYGTLNKTFYGYTAYFSVFLACGVFVFFKYCKLFDVIANNEKASRIVSKISGCSFGIYLMHMIVFNLLAEFIPKYCWEWRLLVPFLIYAICLVCTLIIKKVPIIKHIVP